MLLPGRIELTTLGDLLGALHRERVTGALELSEPNGASHRVHFRAGVVSGVETSLSCPPLGRVLLDMGALSGAARRALELFSVIPSDVRIGARLLDAAYVDAETLAAALRRQVQARLDALARVVRARVSFRPKVHGSSGEVALLSPSEFLHGRPRRRRGVSAKEGPRLSSRSEAFAVLGLTENAGPAEIRGAFRRLAGQLHPDTNAASSEAERRALEQRFARASAAYHLLVA